MKHRLITWLLRQRHVQTWLLAVARPRASAEEVRWTNDDAGALQAFFETNTGKKLLLDLENFKADTETDMVLRATDSTAFASICHARGLRNTIARLKELTAVRQNPDETEPGAVALPPGLEHLSDT